MGDVISLTNFSFDNFYSGRGGGCADRRGVGVGIGPSELPLVQY